MKKLISLYVLATLLFGFTFISRGEAKINEADFYSPWQFLSRASTSSTTAIVTFEAFSDQNAIIDQITLRSDTSNARVWINHLTREATAFSVTPVNDVIFRCRQATNETTTLGAGHPELPLWIGDKGWAVQITIEGATVADLVVNGRRGTLNPRQPSIASEKGY